jgi:hypothetical protein
MQIYDKTIWNGPVTIIILQVIMIKYKVFVAMSMTHPFFWNTDAAPMGLRLRPESNDAVSYARRTDNTGADNLFVVTFFVIFNVPALV